MGAAAHDLLRDRLRPLRALGVGAALMGRGRVGMMGVGAEWKSMKV